MTVIPLIKNTSEQMDSNFAFKLTANSRDSHTFATHKYVMLDHFQKKINDKVYFFPQLFDWVLFVNFAWKSDDLLGHIYAEI